MITLGAMIIVGAYNSNPGGVYLLTFCLDLLALIIIDIHWGGK